MSFPSDVVDPTPPPTTYPKSVATTAYLTLGSADSPPRRKTKTTCTQALFSIFPTQFFGLSLVFSSVSVLPAARRLLWGCLPVFVGYDSFCGGQGLLQSPLLFPPFRQQSGGRWRFYLLHLLLDTPAGHPRLDRPSWAPHRFPLPPPGDWSPIHRGHGIPHFRILHFRTLLTPSLMEIVGGATWTHPEFFGTMKHLFLSS